MASDLDKFGFKPIPQNELAQFGFQAELAPHMPMSAEQPGAVEAGLRGLEQGATLGFGDEINAGLGTFLDTLTGRNKQLGILDDYRKQREESRAAMEAAQQAHPYISGAANLLGGVAPALLTGGASLPEQGLAGAAKLGAAYGALGGLGGSEADLTKGQLGQAAKDVTAGGVGGAVLGGTVHAGAEAFGNQLAKAGLTLGKTAKNIASTPLELPMVAEPIESLKQGLGGQKLYGVQANRDLQQKFLGAAKNLETSMGAAENEASAAKNQALLGSTQGIDMRPWLKDYKTMSGNIQQKLGSNPQVLSELDTLNNYLQRFMQGSAEEGVAPGLTGGKATPEKLEELRDVLKEWSATGDNAFKNRYVRGLVTRLIAPLERAPNLAESKMGIPEGFTPIKPLLTNAVPGLEDLNAKISSIEKAKEIMPSLNDLMNVEKTSQSGTTALGAFQDFFKTLPKDVAGNQEEELMTLAKGRDIANKIAAPGLSHGFLANTVRGTALTGANMIGLGVKGLYNMAPEGLQALSKTVATEGSQAAQKLATMLSSAAERDNFGRNALFFAIQQNPEYRRIIENASGGGKQPPK